MNLRFTPAAERDLEHIRDAIVVENPTAADRVQQSIARAIELLNIFPYMGRSGAVPGTREKTVTGFPYVIVYAVDDPELVILRIYHGAQDRG
jgi:toxin ParE1/3/4